MVNRLQRSLPSPSVSSSVEVDGQIPRPGINSCLWEIMEDRSPAEILVDGEGISSVKRRF